MAVKIFYSWQSDTNKKVNRYFIRDSVEQAIRKIGQSLEIEDSLYLDQDTKDIPGSPEIANTILQKVEECDIFLSDLTFVAQTDKGKNIPNPNVLIEFGYALKVVGSERFIAVMNEAYGKAEDGLPFDLAHRRWPIRYNLSEGVSAELFKETKVKLSSQIEVAIVAILKNGVLLPKKNGNKLNEVDRALFQLFLKELPSDGEGMRLLSKHDLGFPFRYSDINELDHFIVSWTDVEHEFVNQELESKRNRLYELMKKFVYELSENGNLTDNSKWFSLGLNDYETRREILELRDKLNEMATEVYEVHQDLVRTGRKLL